MMSVEDMTAKFHRAAQLKIRGLSQTKVAKELEVTTATICNWQRNSTYRSIYREYVKQSMSDSIAELRALNEISVYRLHELVSSEDENVALRASKLVFELNGFTRNLDQAYATAYWLGSD